MYIFLPHLRNGLNDVFQKYLIADPVFTQQIFPLSVEKLGQVRVPKFKFSFDMTPVEVMKKLGLS